MVHVSDASRNLTLDNIEEHNDSYLVSVLSLTTTLFEDAPN